MDRLSRPVARASLLVAAAVAVWWALPAGAAGSDQQDPPRQDPADQRPVFRSSADFVRVDVYPRQRGRVVEGLSVEDFQVVENGVPQQIATFEFIAFERWDDGGEELQPRSPHEAWEMAADGRNRVFVIYLDTYHTRWEGAYRARQPLLDYLQVGLGPRDLFGVLTPEHHPDALELGRSANAASVFLTVEQTWGKLNSPPTDPEEILVSGCGLLTEWRFDRVLTGLEGVIDRLAAMREERKNIVLISDAWPNVAGLGTIGGRVVPAAPAYDAPSNQRGRGSFTPSLSGLGSPVCTAAQNRLSGMDFRRRFFELPERARAANVAFYVMPPDSQTLFNDPTDQFRILADETDGLSVRTNDLFQGFARISEHLTGYYMIGFESTHGPGDGRPRRIEVTTSRSGVDLELKRDYYPATPAGLSGRAESLSALVRTEIDEALDQLDRIRDSKRVYVHASRGASTVSASVEIDPLVLRSRRGAPRVGQVTVLLRDADGRELSSVAGEIHAPSRSTRVDVPIPEGTTPVRVLARVVGAAASVSDFVEFEPAPDEPRAIGSPVIYRAGSLPSQPFEAAARFEFHRTERVRIEWPVRAVPASHTVRVVNQDGDERLTDIETSLEAGVLRADVRLLSLAAGDYVVEVVVESDASAERRFLALRVLR